VQPWSNGKVGLNGISYYGINQWHVASLQPPHLAAMCVWEGAADWYRDMTHHGGILSTFWGNWYDMQVKSVQYGLGARGPRSRVTGALVCGDDTLSDRDLHANRSEFGDEVLAHPLDDAYHRARAPQWDRITVPLLSAANCGGQGLHPRGNFEGFQRAASGQKWLEAHGLEHWTISPPTTCRAAETLLRSFLEGRTTRGQQLRAAPGSTYDPLSSATRMT
jgi:predicted acyl esterase